jgi:hypothetical protein
MSVGTWKKYHNIIIYTKMRNRFLPYMTSDEIVDLVSYLERGTKMLEIGGVTVQFFYPDWLRN